MTTVTDSTPQAPLAAQAAGSVQVRAGGPAPLRLVRAELLKIWTTNTWWIFGILSLAVTGIALLVNTVVAENQLNFAEQQANQPPPDFKGGFAPGQGPSPDEIRRIEEDWARQADVGRVATIAAANIYTSGQLFGLLFMVVLGALVVSNEFFHQTATVTFLTTPRRTSVILGKLTAAMLLAAGFWAVTTAISVGIGASFFSLGGYDPGLTDWPIQRSVLMNLLAYVVWAVLGVGVGVLIRSQLGATLTAAALYLLSYPLAVGFFGLIRQYVIRADWVLDWMVVVPGIASRLMTAAEPELPGFGGDAPAWWIGALVLVGYAVVTGVIGTLITRRRDIS